MQKCVFEEDWQRLARCNRTQTYLATFQENISRKIFLRKYLKGNKSKKNIKGLKRFMNIYWM